MASPDECELVKRNADWTYEGIAFYTRLPDEKGAACGDRAALVDVDDAAVLRDVDTRSDLAG